MGFRALFLAPILALLVGCGDSERWPDPGSRLNPLAVDFPAGFSRRVFIDAGHGAPGNTGNRSAFCVDEQDFTLALADELAAALTATGHFEVRVSRQGTERVPYAQRVQDAERFEADAFVSLHSDVRGRVESWTAAPGKQCPRNRTAPGFALLFADDGAEHLVARRRALARGLGGALRATGLLPYDGTGYAPDYLRDAPGVFVDRHPEASRIYVLHEPTVPSVIIETHNALDDREARRWEDPETRQVFARAIARGLLRSLR